MRARRNFLVAAALSMLATLPVGRAQEKARRIGFLAPLSRSTPSDPDVYYDAFVAGMRELGYIEGRNVLIEWRFADSKFERLAGLAADLANVKDLELIVTHSTPAIKALQQATRTTPIVFAVALDPVGSGFAASLARPGGNITGLAVVDVDPTPKRLELLKAIVPTLSRVAVLVNPGTAVHAGIVKGVRAAGQQIGVDVIEVQGGSVEQLERSFGGMAAHRVDGAIVADDAFFRGQRRQIASLAAKNRLPVIAPWREYTVAGGLISYGQDIAASFRRAASYVDRIFRGAKPGELPIEQPTRIHFAINRKAAKALGLAIPQDLLVLADEVLD